MACSEPLMKQEQSFLRVLQSTTTFKIIGNTLEFRDGQRLLAVLKSVPERLSKNLSKNLEATEHFCCGFHEK